MNIGSVNASYTALFAGADVPQLSSSARDSSVAGVLTTRAIPSVDSPSPVSSGGGSASPTALPESESEVGNSQENSARDRQEKLRLEQDRREITQLAARDREVRAHEQAHAAVGGQYAGAPRYEYQRGPDGINYAVGGEVSIDVSPAASPEQTIQKMQIVRRAALAPAEPSAQDRRVAAQASQNEAQARADLAVERSEEAQYTASSNEGENDENALVDESAANNLGSHSASSVNVAPPFNSIQSQLDRSISATSLSSRTGSLLDQLA